MSKFVEYCNRVISENKLTDAMIRAFGKTANVKRICDGCGFITPTYSGRYHERCVVCGDTTKKIVMESEDS